MILPVGVLDGFPELRLKRANEDLQENGMKLIVPSDIKMNILEKLAETV